MEEHIEWDQLTAEGCIERCSPGCSVGLRLFGIFSTYLVDEYRQSLLHLPEISCIYWSAEKKFQVTSIHWTKEIRM